MGNLNSDEDLRISLEAAREKSALLLHQGSRFAFELLYPQPHNTIHRSQLLDVCRALEGCEAEKNWQRIRDLNSCMWSQMSTASPTLGRYYAAVGRPFLRPNSRNERLHSKAVCASLLNFLRISHQNCPQGITLLIAPSSPESRNFDDPPCTGMPGIQVNLWAHPPLDLWSLGPRRTHRQMNCQIGRRKSTCRKVSCLRRSNFAAP